MGVGMMCIHLKRVYDQPSKEDGYRVLIDRLWPRGVSKEKAHADQWLKEVGPSHQLRQWFQHDPEKFASFKEKYQQELTSGAQKEAFEQLKHIVQINDVVTLIFATRETSYNHAVVLKGMLESKYM